MKRYALKYACRCKVCKKPLDAGATAWMQKNPTSGKWDVFCPACVDTGGTTGVGAVTPAAVTPETPEATDPGGVNKMKRAIAKVAQMFDDDESARDIEVALMGLGYTALGAEAIRKQVQNGMGGEPPKKPPPVRAQEPPKSKCPKMTLDYIKENAAWRLEV